jgi:hypothetical protein
MLRNKGRRGVMEAFPTAFSPRIPEPSRCVGSKPRSLVPQSRKRALGRICARSTIQIWDDGGRSGKFKLARGQGSNRSRCHRSRFVNTRGEAVKTRGTNVGGNGPAGDRFSASIP